jgi:phosphoglycolate phosphatase
MSIEKPTIIAFDWDNTLVDTWPIISMAINKTRKHFGLNEWNFEEIRENIGGSLRDVFPNMFGESWLEAKDIYLGAFEEIHIEELRALPYAEEMLKTANEIAEYVLVISNKTHNFLEKEINHIGWGDYIKCAVGAGIAKKDKPDSSLMDYVAEKIGFPNNIYGLGKKMWYIGDSKVDVEFANNLGAFSVVYSEKTYINNGLQGVAPDFEIRGIEDFYSLCKKNSRKT